MAAYTCHDPEDVCAFLGVRDFQHMEQLGLHPQQVLDAASNTIRALHGFPPLPPRQKILPGRSLTSPKPAAAAAEEPEAWEIF